jgi:tryptophan-rich sensory protein
LIRKDRVFQNLDPHERGWFPGSSAPLSPKLALLGFVGLCLLVGAASGGLTANSLRTWYLTLTAPPLTPPRWVFGPVWAALYVAIGVAGWMVWRRSVSVRPLRLWGWQLLANALWAPAFFGLHRPDLALVMIAAILVLTGLTINAFARVSRLAAWLMVPYLVWICFTAYLNVGFCWLNRF